jgi:hypothetical protein
VNQSWFAQANGGLDEVPDWRARNPRRTNRRMEADINAAASGLRGERQPAPFLRCV